MDELNLNKIPHSCGIQLRAVYGSLKTAERKAAEFLLEHPDLIHRLNTEEFSKQAGCSQATVVRLAKRLGYEGYPELRRDFGSQDGRNPYSSYQGISLTDSSLEVLGKIFDASKAALEDTLNVIDPAAYSRSVEALLAADQIMFCGVGDAALVAQEAFQRWVRIGQKCHFAVDPDLQLILASQLAPGDVLVAVSHSGRSRSVLNTVREAERAKATIVAITNYPVSPLAKRARFVLQTAVFTTITAEEVMAKRIAELCIIEGLYASFLLGKGGTSIGNLERANAVVKVNKI